MLDDEEQVQKDPDADLPKFKVRHSDMNIELVKIIVRKVSELFTAETKKAGQLLEKNICMSLVDFLKKDKAHFGGGEGEWQCIIGKNLAASLIYELHMLTFLDLPQFGRSILVFKSG